jgi:hypothetical protein
MITKDELVQGIRFAGERAAAAAENCKDWDYQLGHQWTTRDAFSHVAATAGGAARMYPALESGQLSKLGVEQIAAMNAQRLTAQAETSKEDLIAQIRAGHEATAAFVETIDDADLAKVVTLGGYEMPKAEIVAQVWIHHQIAHAYEASARWPLL